MKSIDGTERDLKEEISLQLQQEHVEARTMWMKFGSRLSHLHFIGKDVIATRIGSHILFHDLSTHTDTIYTANNHTSGDGISCVAGHQNTTVFAFGEKCTNPCIFIKQYPSFTTVSVLKGGSGSYYKSVDFSEMGFLISLSSLPDFEIIVWNWRTAEKLVSQKTGINNENQILRCSQAIPPVVSQVAVDSSKLLLWELHACCRKCILTRVEFNIDAAVLPCMFTWSPDGMLFLVDATGRVFTIEVEKRKLQHIFSCAGGLGTAKSFIVWYKTGIVVSGPSGELSYYKKVAATEWQIIWSFLPEVQLAVLSSCPGNDYLIAMSEEADMLQFNIDDERPKFIKIGSYGRHFVFLCFINPSGDHIATLNASGFINIWAVNSGNLVGELGWNKKCLVMVSNPLQSYLVLGRDDGIVDFINVFASDNPKILTAVNLCNEGISGIQISQQGNYVVACTMKTGIFFVIESNPGVQIEVKSFINAKVKVVNFFAVELMAVLKIVALISTRLCCPSGNKIIVFSMACVSKEVIQQTFIDLPGLYSGIYINPFGKYELYAIPHCSRQFHLLHISLETEQLQLMDARLTGHQLRKYGMNVTEHNILTYGLDGMALLRSVETKDCIVYVIPHHHMDLGIKTAIASPLNTYIISLGQDGSMICTYTGTKTDQLKETSMSSVPLTKEICHTYTQRQTSGFTKMIGTKNARSWLELQDDIKVMQEAALWSEENVELHKQFRSIQKECVALLEKNYINPPDEKVPVSAFHVDEETRIEKIRKTQNKCKEIELYLKALIVAQDKLCETLKQRYWSTAETKGRKLKAIMGEAEVENYPLFPKDVSYEEELGRIIEYTKLEVQMQEGNSFSPWDASDERFEVSHHSSLGALHNASHATQKITSIGTIHEEVEEEEQINQLSLTGSSSYHFIEPCPFHHNQFELATYHQMHNEIILLTGVCTDLRTYFNKHFDNIYALKEREMLLVTERNARLRYILSEMNSIWTEIVDPEWSQEEQPERLMKVDENEVSITPCISDNQQILEKLTAKAEAHHLAQLADNFHDKALFAMMDGVLEVRWEDEIKKDIPKPKCMLEKSPEDYNEEDLGVIKDYNEKVALRFIDRAHYRKMLETEFHELSQTLKDDVMKFNSQLAQLFLLKLKIEAAIGQETLKIERYKYMVHKRLCLNQQEKKLKIEVMKQESSNSALQEQIQQLQIWTNDCRATYDVVVAREKHLEKNFKKDFPEVSQVVLEQLLKFYRRRPNMHQHAQTSVILLNELSQWTVSAGRPLFLPSEHLDFLKGLDQIDSYANSPPIINEDMWATLCRLRRMKVECELKAKCCALEVADSEHTVCVYQKLLAGQKQRITTLQDETHKTREQLLELQHNTELQLVMKQGLVEINTTGLISDFDDAILITCKQVESVNELIKKAGNQKLAAMHRAHNFHQGILIKEWEHKKLRMEIEALQDHLHNLQSIKVTRDIQLFLNRQAEDTEDKTILSLEQELDLLKQSYEKTIQEIQKQLDDLDKKISTQKKENQRLDNKVTDLNIDINEQQLLRDFEFESRQTEAAKQRMTSIVTRSQLAAIIKKQHSEILVLQMELELLRLKTYPTLILKTTF